MDTRIVDSEALYRAIEHRRFGAAKNCPHLALDKRDTPCLWHRSYCTHFDRPDPTVAGRFEPCDLVWRGACPFYPKKAIAKLLAKGD